jgi:hypothetical protein
MLAASVIGGLMPPRASAVDFLSAGDLPPEVDLEAALDAGPAQPPALLPDGVAQRLHALEARREARAEERENAPRFYDVPAFDAEIDDPSMDELLEVDGGAR